MSHQFSDNTFRSKLTDEQFTMLLRPVDANRVGTSNGQSNMEAYDIRAHLNRIFGFGNWDGEAETMELIAERWGENRSGKPAVTVAYRCRYTLRVRTTAGEPLATYTEWAMGDAPNFPEFKYGDAHDFAMKTAESQALKRCAINLGDQFGLSLYRKGSLDALVGWSLAKPEGTGATTQEPVERTVPDVVPEQDPDTANHGERNGLPAPAPKQDAAPARDERMSIPAQWQEIAAFLDELKHTTKEAKTTYLQKWSEGNGRKVESVRELTKDEAAALIAHVQKEFGNS